MQRNVWCTWKSSRTSNALLTNHVVRGSFGMEMRSEGAHNLFSGNLGLSQHNSISKDSSLLYQWQKFKLSDSPFPIAKQPGRDKCLLIFFQDAYICSFSKFLLGSVGTVIYSLPPIIFLNLTWLACLKGKRNRNKGFTNKSDVDVSLLWETAQGTRRG